MARLRDKEVDEQMQPPRVVLVFGNRIMTPTRQPVSPPSSTLPPGGPRSHRSPRERPLRSQHERRYGRVASRRRRSIHTNATPRPRPRPRPRPPASRYHQHGRNVRPRTHPLAWRRGSEQHKARYRAQEVGVGVRFHRVPPRYPLWVLGENPPAVSCPCPYHTAMATYVADTLAGTLFVVLVGFWFIRLDQRYAWGIVRVSGAPA